MFRLAQRQGKRRLFGPLLTTSELQATGSTIANRTFHNTAPRYEGEKKETLKEKMNRLRDKKGNKMPFPDMEEMIQKSAGVGSFNFQTVWPDNDDEKMTFASVGGQEEAKEELYEIVDFVRNRQKYMDLGAKIPSGCLLTGPPGNGKTMLAKALAGECDVPFVVANGSQFIEKIGGLGPKRVREIFKYCRDIAPCILFIDEIDTIASKRSGDSGPDGSVGSSYSERANIVNQILVEMDGLREREEIFVIGATNRDEVLDPAITRPGRLDRKVYISNPEETERVEIFKIYMKQLVLSDNLKLDDYAVRLAECTPGYSGAEIATICNEAAMNAARFAKSSVTVEDFEKAFEKMVAGLEKLNPSVSQKELKMVAHYFAAKAIVAFHNTTVSGQVMKVSVAPRKQQQGGQTGFIHYGARKGATYLLTKEHLLNTIQLELAGRAAEMVFYGHNTTQAAKDLDRATKVAYSIVADYGMGRSASNISYHEARSQVPRRVNLWSNKQQNEMDKEVSEIVKEQYEFVEQAIRDNLGYFGTLANELYSKRTMNDIEIEKVFTKCKSKISADQPSYKLFGDLNVKNRGNLASSLKRLSLYKV